MYRHHRSPARYSLAEARAVIRRSMTAAAELRRDADILPRINPDGSSDCPFAEELYYRKEKTVQFVRDDLREMRGFLESSVNHIGIAQNKIHELAYEREQLNGEKAQDRFAEAELKLAAEMRRHQEIRRDLMDAIAEVEATLREAGSKQFPGGSPRGPYGKPLYSEPRIPQPMEKLTANNAKAEIERLLRPSKEL